MLRPNRDRVPFGRSVKTLTDFLLIDIDKVNHYIPL